MVSRLAARGRLASQAGVVTAPANDTRATAEQLNVGFYYGTATGTTFGATEDAGGPVDGFGVSDVFYYWDDLPAGMVYVYVKPADTSIFFEAGLAAGLPEDIDDAVIWLISAYNGLAVDEPFNPCVMCTHHSGGPLTLFVYSYPRDPDDASVGPIDFRIAWGHSNDTDASHYGTEQNDTSASFDESDPPPSFIDYVYATYRPLLGWGWLYTTDAGDLPDLNWLPYLGFTF